MLAKLVKNDVSVIYEARKTVQCVRKFQISWYGKKTREIKFHEIFIYFPQILAFFVDNFGVTKTKTKF